jgi:hypothetical protein
LIGEWGGFMSGDNLKWMEYLRDLIGKENLNHTFWCFNANSGDTGGLVKDDFITWDEDKYALVETVLWKNDDGKFIGLDHEVALGANGISLSDHAGNAPTPVLNEGSSSPDTVVTETGSETTTATTTETQTTTAGTENPTQASPAAQTPSGDNGSKDSSVNSGTLIGLLVVSVLLLIVIIVLNVRKYNKNKLDSEFEERMKSEDEAFRDNQSDTQQ